MTNPALSDPLAPGALSTLLATFQRWLLVRDVEPLLVTFASVAANLLDGDPVWLFLVAPPAGVKTEIIRALSGLPVIYPLSNLTAQTFASGFQHKGAEEVSLLLKLDRRILTLKDFTTVLTMYREKRAEILAQLREIYDGQYRKEFGNGKVVEWSGKVGLIAGVTPILDTQYTVNQVLGERFLLYRIGQAEEVEVAKRAISSQGQEAVMRRELREAVTAFFHPLVSPRVPLISGVLTDRLAALAAFTARARSGVVWDGRGEIEYIPEPEGPARLAKQLATLARGLAVIRNTPDVTEADYRVVSRVAGDTIPAQRKALLMALTACVETDAVQTSALAERIGYPISTVRRYLHELRAMGLVDCLPGQQGRTDQWRPSDLATHLCQAATAPLAPTVSVMSERGG